MKIKIGQLLSLITLKEDHMEEKQFIRHLPRASVLTLKDQISYQEGQIASKTLAQNKNVSLTLFAFDKDEEISSHQSTGDAMIQVLEGKARIMVGKEFFEVSEGESILMPHDVDHAVYALEPMKMCLTIVFPYER